LNRPINKQIEELRNLIESNHKITREYILSALSPIEENLNKLHEKINKILFKKKQTHEMQKLRDTVSEGLFPLYLCNARSAFSYKHPLHKSELKIDYTILYHIGLHINKVRCLKLIDIEDALDLAQFNLIHYKFNK